LSVRIEEYLDSIVKFLRIHPLIKNMSIHRKIVTRAHVACITKGLTNI